MSNNTPKILGIIPAREGSKRVKHKNFRPFAGTTLVDIAIQQSQQAKLLTDIVLSTDSEEVLQIGSKYEGIINIKRPVELSDDKSPAVDYIIHTLEYLKDRKKYNYDIIVILQPSSPLRKAEDIDGTIETLLKHPEKEGAVSVVKVDHMVHPVKLKKMEGDNLLPFLEEESGRFAAHELPDIYVRNCAVYATRVEAVRKNHSAISPDSVGYVMPQDTSVDINEMIEFEFAEYLYTKSEK